MIVRLHRNNKKGNSMFKAIYAFAAGFGVLGALAWCAFIVGMLIGYGMNIWHVAQHAIHGLPITTLFVAQAIGIFFGPLGGVLGWLA